MGTISNIYFLSERSRSGIVQGNVGRVIGTVFCQSCRVGSDEKRTGLSAERSGIELGLGTTGAQGGGAGGGDILSGRVGDQDQQQHREYLHLQTIPRLGNNLCA